MRRLTARLLLVLGGLLLGLVMVEAVFRLAGPNVPLDLTMARFQAYHPVYGFFHQPGVSGWVRTDEFTSFVKFNTQGLRGPEVAIPKPAGTFRALVLGDSVVEGAQVGEDRKSLALNLEFRAPDRTLTDEEVAERRQAIKAKLDEIGGTLRE